MAFFRTIHTKVRISPASSPYPSLTRLAHEYIPLRSRATGMVHSVPRLGTPVPPCTPPTALQAAPTSAQLEQLRQTERLRVRAKQRLHRARTGLPRAPMLHTSSHQHPSLHPGGGGVAATLTTCTRAASRSPRLKIAPPRLQQRRRGQPPPHASRDISRAYAAHPLPPAPQPSLWQ
eukprot:scaffold14943_cov120-Isochrysis_galbana.AAC.3